MREERTVSLLAMKSSLCHTATIAQNRPTVYSPHQSCSRRRYCTPTPCSSCSPNSQVCTLCVESCTSSGKRLTSLSARLLLESLEKRSPEFSNNRADYADGWRWPLSDSICAKMSTTSWRRLSSLIAERRWPR